MQRIHYSIEVIEPPGLQPGIGQLGPGRHLVGRGPACAIRADLRGLSREHTEIEVLPDGGLRIRDLGSTNGTRVDGQLVADCARHGDVVLQLGPLQLRLIEHDAADAVLGFSTGMSMPTPPPPTAVADERTQLRTLQQALADAAWLSFDVSRADAGAVASRVFACWLPVLGVDGLRLRDGAGSVLAMAGSFDGPCEVLATAGGLVLEACGGEGMPALDGVLGALLPWFPPLAATPEPADGPDPQLPGVGTGDADLRRRLEAVRRVARSRVGVLVLGETGCGKELLARWIHQCSTRSEGPFVAINCAALPRDLLEAELFGVEKGAATGVEARPGVFERAHGGTLFLDELGDMPPETQVRLLRALEEGRVHRVGSKQPVEVDVRLVSATHCDLGEAIEQRRFRLDLYHRLAGFEVVLPPLRERRVDIAPLAIHFFGRALAESGQHSPGMTQAALRALGAWDWPGNVRELRQVVEGATATLLPGEALDLRHLPARIVAVADRHPSGAAAEQGDTSLAAAVAAAERAAFERAIDDCHGDPEGAWRRLGIGKTTFYKKLRELGLRPPAAAGD